MNTAVQINYVWMAKDDLSDEDAVTVDQDSSRSSESENDHRLDTPPKIRSPCIMKN